MKTQCIHVNSFPSLPLQDIISRSDITGVNRTTAFSLATSAAIYIILSLEFTHPFINSECLVSLVLCDEEPDAWVMELASLWPSYGVTKIPLNLSELYRLRHMLLARIFLFTKIDIHSLSLSSLRSFLGMSRQKS